MNNYDTLKQAVIDLLNKRSATNRVYDESYDFVFKSWGTKEWSKLMELVNWTEEDGYNYRKENDCLLDYDDV